MSAIGWIQLLGLGGLMGAIGQLVRMIVAIKQLNDIASAATAAGIPTSVKDLIEAHRLVVSLAIGFVAGTLAAMATSSGNVNAIAGTQLAGWIAAGYAGADFIEGFMARVIPVVPAPAAGPVIAVVGIQATETASGG